MKCLEAVQLEADAEGEAEALRLFPVGVGLSVAVQVTESEKLKVRRTLAVQEGVPVRLTVSVGVDVGGLFVMLCVAEAVGERESVAERRDRVKDVGDAKLGVPVPLRKRVPVRVSLRVILPELGVTEDVGVQLRVAETDCAPLDVSEGDRVGLQLELRLAVADSGVRVEQECVGDELNEYVGVPVEVPVEEKVGVVDGLGKMEQLALTVRVWVGEDEGDVENEEDRSEETVRV